MPNRKPWLACLHAGVLSVLCSWQSMVWAQAQQPAHAVSDDAGTGIRLTRSGHFADAIPYLEHASLGAGDGRPFAVRFDLALCYFGTMQYLRAIAELEALRGAEHDSAEVNKLLVQAYIAAGQRSQARAAFARAQEQAAYDEKLYDFAADACSDHGEYELGLSFVDTGLKALPDSARLHYERGLLLARMDRLEEAMAEFARSTALAPSTDIGVLSGVQGALYRNNAAEALRLVRQAISAGHRDYQMLSLLGTVLMQTGVRPGDPEFAEARHALETSVLEHPQYAASQLALGKLDLEENRPAEAKEHLETARRLQPANPSVYTSLASAYGRLGRQEQRLECLKMLERLSGEKNAGVAVSR